MSKTKLATQAQLDYLARLGVTPEGPVTSDLASTLINDELTRQSKERWYEDPRDYDDDEDFNREDPPSWRDDWNDLD